MSANSVPSLTFSSSRPLWYSENQLAFHLRIMFRCSFWLLYGGECCWGAAASAAVVDWLHGCGGVDGLVRSRVWAEALHLCQSWSDELVKLQWAGSICGAAMHLTLPPRGARLTLWYSTQGRCTSVYVPLAFSLLCAVSWAKAWNMACPIQISSVKWWLWRKVRCTPVKVFQCRRSKWFSVAAYVLWSRPPWLPLIYFATPSFVVSPTFCCSGCLSFCGILTPAVIGVSKCDIIRHPFIIWAL